MVSPKGKYSRRDLVCLAYAKHNSSCVEVTREVPEGFVVDAEAGTWGLAEGTRSEPFEKREFRIGERSRIPEWGYRRGLIGVYDRTKLVHLNAMVHRVEDALRLQESTLGD